MWPPGAGTLSTSGKHSQNSAIRRREPLQVKCVFKQQESDGTGGFFRFLELRIGEEKKKKSSSSMQLLINLEKLLRYSGRTAENRREQSGTEEARLLLRWKKNLKKT